MTVLSPVSMSSCPLGLLVWLKIGEATAGGKVGFGEFTNVSNESSYGEQGAATDCDGG